MKLGFDSRLEEGADGPHLPDLTVCVAQETEAPVNCEAGAILRARCSITAPIAPTYSTYLNLARSITRSIAPAFHLRAVLHAVLHLPLTCAQYCTLRAARRLADWQYFERAVPC
jgi:hypothetical protein